MTGASAVPRSAGKLATAMIAVLAATLISPPAVGATPRTRVVDCETGSCLVVTGSRRHAGAAVAINGHAVDVEGTRRWQTTLPVETLRAWSAPRARTITVTLLDPVGGPYATEEVALPIGLLGHSADLAMVVVRAK